VRAALLALSLAAGSALAADEDALSIADKAAMAPEQARDWRFFTEGALRTWDPQATGESQSGERLSFDFRYDGALTPRLRAVFADRLDMNRYGAGVPGDGNVNTWKEGYLSWQAKPDLLADLGRINVRNGVAFGYNPTDYFKVNAVRSVVSIDPASLRENRMGSVMARGQALWATGSFTALVSPKLADDPDSGAYSPDIGATNLRDRWLLALSQKVSPAITPQFLLFGAAGQPPQLGLNLTTLFGDATVAYAEWSGGRSRSLAAQAGVAPDDEAFRSRLATGATYTTAANLSLTLEYQYNGAGLDEAGWNALRDGSPALYRQYRLFTVTVQDPPTRQLGFAYALWQDALVKHLDLAAMLRYDVTDHSRLQWLEARYHFTRADLAVQAQYNSGDATTNFGALYERRSWQLLLRYFL
jgi:hypothetical protein